MILLLASATTPTSAVVPEVRGNSLAAAYVSLLAAGITASTGSPVYSDTFSLDTVATQSVAAGTVVANGSVVTIALSLGPTPYGTVALIRFDEPTHGKARFR